MTGKHTPGAGFWRSLVDICMSYVCGILIVLLTNLIVGYAWK